MLKKCKVIISLLLVLVMTFSAVSLPASAEEKEDFTWKPFDKPYVTFIFDDGRMPFTEQCFEIFKSYNMPMSCAVPAMYVDQNGKAYNSKLFNVLREIQAAGGEILSHGYSHKPVTSAIQASDPNVSTCSNAIFTMEDIDAEFKKSYDVLIQGGFDVKGIISVGCSDSCTSYSDKSIVEKITRKYFAYSNGYGVSTQYSTERYWPTTFAQSKSYIDKAIANNDWVILSAHEYGDNWGNINEEALIETLDYIVEKGVEVVTWSDMYYKFGKYTGNLTNSMDDEFLDFEPFKGDVNLDGFLNLKDLVRYKKYIVKFDENSVIDEDSADFNEDKQYDGTDLIGLQDAVIEKLFGADSVQDEYAPSDWRSHPEDYKLIAFTFDDGPAFDEFTLDDPAVKILKLLNQYEGNGTYFYTGNAIRKDNGMLKWLIDNGAEIANHSDTHITFDGTVSYDEAKRQITNVNKLLNSYGVIPKYFRAGGYSSDDTLAKVLKELKIPHITHQLAYADYVGGTQTAEHIANSIMNNASDGAVVGLHSTNKNYVTSDALGIALPYLYEQGYRFCTVDELFKLRNVSDEDIPYGSRIRKVKPDGSIVSY